MKFTHQVILMFFPIVFIAILGCPKTIRNSGLQVINLTEDDFGKKLIIAKGEVFTLTLPNRADGGYKFDKEQYDSSVLQLEKHIKRSPSANSALGKPGEDVWEFVALKKGKTVLKITASRPGTKRGIITEFENEVIVK
jgi:predicted secreted protein